MAVTPPTGTGQILPLLNVGPAVADVATLTATYPAASYPNRIVSLAASTSPGGACLAFSDGVAWYPVAISGTAIS